MPDGRPGRQVGRDRPRTARRHRPPGALRPGRARPRTSCAAGWPTASRRSASPSPTSRRTAGDASGDPGRRHPGARCWSRPGSVPRGCRSAAGLAAGRPWPPWRCWRRPTMLLGSDGDRLALKWPNDIVAVARRGPAQGRRRAGRGRRWRGAAAQRGRGPRRQRRLAGRRLPAGAGGRHGQPAARPPGRPSTARPCWRPGWPAWCRATRRSWRGRFDGRRWARGAGDHRGRGHGGDRRRPPSGGPATGVDPESGALLVREPAERQRCTASASATCVRCRVVELLPGPCNG